MKAVLPALTGQGHDHLAIQDGGMASLEFLRVTYGDVSESERAAVRQQLDEYCGLDTEGMFWIVEELQNLVGLRSKSVLSRSLRGSVKICVQKMGAGDGCWFIRSRTLKRIRSQRLHVLSHQSRYL